MGKLVFRIEKSVFQLGNKLKTRLLAVILAAVRTSEFPNWHWR